MYTSEHSSASTNVSSSGVDARAKCEFPVCGDAFCSAAGEYDHAHMIPIPEKCVVGYFTSQQQRIRLHLRYCYTMQIMG